MSLVTKLLGHKQERSSEVSPEKLYMDATAGTPDKSDDSYLRNFVLIEGGEFMMGSPASELLRGSDETQHQVWVSTFSLCKYTVTVAEFRRYAEESGYRSDASKGLFRFIPRYGEEKMEDGVYWFKGVFGKDRPRSEDNHPVLYVNWHDAVAYCQWLTEKTGKVFRLPTEAEWEYACRAGTTTPFNTRENLTTGQANHKGGNPYFNNHKVVYRQNTVAVNNFVPNAWGLYNMHGNVWEWCSDWYSGSSYDESLSSGTVANPAGTATGLVRVLRGGSWNCEARLCRSAYRYNARPSLRTNVIGFRLFCEQ